MPQMSPLNWLSLMILFSAILVLFNTLNFYSFSYQVKQKKLSFKKKETNWKW
uniref:ATP synthase complex subunit 8 n=1 Tax=Ulomoides dermestoides TaxID=1552300 RepID=A0A0U1XI94_9CUCU|nr:ATP synthase F0 subunit 8 [Ulomoides dermestoides]AIS67601.1 ATP synthase F0 subunit 8 [Ulomoides dermestoides]